MALTSAQNLAVVLLYFIGLFQANFGLLTVPIPDDLLGPGQCPSGSFCIDTNFCTHEYYTTKSGLPFYCGPHKRIDAMICCLGTLPELFRGNDESSPGATPLNNPQEYEQVTTDDNEDPQRFHRSNSNGTFKMLDDEEEDDEMSILSVPYSVNNLQDNVRLPNTNELDGEFDSLNDLEALVEEAIKQEYQELNTRPKLPITEEPNYIIVPDAALSSKDESMQPPIYNDEAEIGVKNGTSIETEAAPSEDVPVDLIDQRTSSFDPKRRSEPLEREQQQRTSRPCICEKGEKGDPGPKGEPGAPGQVIYIPVFVNSVTGASAPPLPFARPEGNPPNQQWQPNAHGNFDPNRPWSQGPPPPQHPNPTVIPYSVPVPTETVMTMTMSNQGPLAAPPVEGQPKIKRTNSQPHPHEHSQQPSAPGSKVQPQSVPVPLPKSVTESLHDRLTRHAAARTLDRTAQRLKRA